MLDAQLDKAMELIEEILFTSKLSDKKRLKEIIAETRAAMKDDLLANGHTTAAGRATAYISKIGVVKELTEGVDYYMYLSDLDDHLKNAMRDWLLIFRRRSVSFCAEIPCS